VLWTIHLENFCNCEGVGRLNLIASAWRLSTTYRMLKGDSTMKTFAKINLLLVLALLLAACQPVAAPVPEPPIAQEPPMAIEPPIAIEPPVAPGPSFDLAGTNWVLSSLDGADPLDGTTVTLSFGADGSAFGSDGCNRFATTFTQDGANLTFNPTAGTMMLCPEPEGVMEQAAAYTAALAQTTNFTANQRQLVLLSGNQILATFVADAQALAGTDWDVTMFNNGREAVVGLIDGTEINAFFGENGELSGNAGCNQYIGSYTVAGNAIEIGQLGSTMRFCAEPEGTMEQEQAFLAALQSAATFRIEGDNLEMRTADDAIAVMMTRRVEIDLPAPSEPATPTGRVVGTQSLNVRSGPGTAFPVIGVARLGDQGELIGRSADGRWWAVSAPSAPGGIGWVSADFVLATNAESVPVMQGPPPPPPPPTPTPLPRPTATPAPAPTATPTAQIFFGADRTTINQGECVTLSWSVQNVQAVWVYPLGANYAAFPRTGQGSEVVCPASTTTYEMRVRMRDGTTQFRQVTINVNVPPPPPAPDPLSGTRWDVVNYNDGVAIVTLIPGTTATLEFGANGQLTGSAGCNTYNATYRVSGNSISISPPGATMRVCPEPAGVMDQEVRFLAALQSSATFRIDGNLLELQNAAGQITVVATRAP
jgi:heat shock protein HslJ